MNIFDKNLKTIFNYFDKFINFLKKITRIEVIKKLEKFAEKIYSSALLVQI